MSEIACRALYTGEVKDETLGIALPVLGKLLGAKSPAPGEAVKTCYDLNSLKQVSSKKLQIAPKDMEALNNAFDKSLAARVKQKHSADKSTGARPQPTRDVDN